MKITVLKGNNTQRNVDIDKIVSNKFAYFSELMHQESIEVTYEELILLKDFISSQFETVDIKIDNRFINLYPANPGITDEIYGVLEAYFSREEDESIDYSSLNKYVDVFTNVVNIDGRYFVTYNDEFTNQDVQKYHFVNVYNNSESKISYEDVDGNEVFDLIDETDYIRLLKKLEAKNCDDIYLNVEGSEFRYDFIIEKLELLSSIFASETDIHVAKKQQIKSKKFDNTAYLGILKKYWKKDSFRTIKMYDTNALEDQIIQTFDVTQDQIMHDIIEQVEACQKNGAFRDVFMTAPTGSGKSAIFQIPAILLAERYNLLTLVISPLIGLMNDQVYGLEQRGYKYSRTINSDISPISKGQIKEEIENNECHILYLSPESLLGKSDLENLIGTRTVGLIVIDEAHIATTWGKQFRPDYWYLGDHIQRQRKLQLDRKHQSFVLATFTATAIYKGVEDMYGETKNSLHMINPITYLGEIKRTNLSVEVEELDKVQSREYENDKFNNLVSTIKTALLHGEKTLVYFPTKVLVDRFYRRCFTEKLQENVSLYFGGMNRETRREYNGNFQSGKTKVMLATKAYGMGIDIDDIVNILHFAPTGNVCDYIQEIGRAARNQDIQGHAIYKYMSNDFQFINRLHGMSVLKDYHLVNVMKKVLELYNEQLKKDKRIKRNALMVDAETFSYIFENPFFGEDDAINKVKTAFLLIQKDFLSTKGYTPFRARPIPLFTFGYFQIPEESMREVKHLFGEHIKLVDTQMNVYQLDLKSIWEHDYELQKFSFPQFKYLLYTGDPKVAKYSALNMKQAIKFEVTLTPNSENTFNTVFQSLKNIILTYVQNRKYYSEEDIIEELMKATKKNHFIVNSIVEIFIKSLKQYMDNVNKNVHARLYLSHYKGDGYSYQFDTEMDTYFRWLERKYAFFQKQSGPEGFFIINHATGSIKEFNLALGLLESWGVITFQALGGTNSQIYLYINQTQSMLDYINRPFTYKNRILQLVDYRHKVSGAMLSYLFGNKFDSQKIWDLVEKYFLGEIPDEVKKKVD
ncbi:MAG: DEAD/DEAH box helicase [Erysipelotrichaceae bacterium]|nr:MAG: DEAD/DEAH box helicase [Erysipelotrichaceae bacterium]